MSEPADRAGSKSASTTSRVAPPASRPEGVASPRRRELAGLGFEEQQQRLAPPRAELPRGASSAPPGAQAALAEPGGELPHRAEMERVFGRDFGSVVAHTGPVAAEAATALGSRAFTVGEHVVFGTPTPDRALVAHELAHVVQQTGGGAGAAAGTHEDDADAAAKAAATGQKASVQGRAAVGVQKWGTSRDPKTGKRQSEHQWLGDQAFAAAYGKYGGGLGDYMGAPDKAVSVRNGKGGISFGAATRQAGDRYATVTNLRNQGKADKVDHYNHTAVVAEKEWRAHHDLALVAADEARRAPGKKAKKAAFARAMRLEAFGAHFLQDAFASGHMVPRALEWVESEERGAPLQRERLPGETYHDALNDAGVATRSGAGAATARGDKSLWAKQNDKNRGAVVKAVERSLGQVMAVATGKLALDEARKQVDEKIAALIPRLDVEGYEATDAGDPEWLEAALVEMMSADFQDEYDAAKGATTKRTTTSGKVKVSGADVAGDRTMTDLFDGELAGRTGLDALESRIARSLEFLVRSLQPQAFGRGAAADAKSAQFAKELLSTLGQRARQVRAQAGAAVPAWLAALEARLGSTWPAYVADLGRQRAALLADAQALRESLR